MKRKKIISIFLLSFIFVGLFAISASAFDGQLKEGQVITFGETFYFDEGDEGVEVSLDFTVLYNGELKHFNNINFSRDYMAYINTETDDYVRAYDSGWVDDTLNTITVLGGDLETMGYYLSNSTGITVSSPVITTINSNDILLYLEKLTKQINVNTVVTVISSAVVLVIGFVFMYWGIRKLVRSLMTAFRKGKISL